MDTELCMVSRGCLNKSRYDPYVGVMHRDEYNRPVLAYDVIEKFRV
jgi:CRISPR-associated protein Cas1